MVAGELLVVDVHLHAEKPLLGLSLSILSDSRLLCMRRQGRVLVDGDDLLLTHLVVKLLPEHLLLLLDFSFHVMDITIQLLFLSIVHRLLELPVTVLAWHRHGHLSVFALLRWIHLATRDDEFGDLLVLVANAMSDNHFLLAVFASFPGHCRVCNKRAVL